MLDLSKLNFNNYCNGINNPFIPNFTYKDFLPVLPIYNTYYFPNMPIFPNFFSFNIDKPIYPVSNYSYNPPPINYKNSNFSYKLENPFNKKTEKKQIKIFEPKIYYSGNQKIDNSYITLSQNQAEQKAKNDKNLELLKGGKNWSVAKESFITDIPYARKGTSAILERVSNMIGEKLVITSALGTGQEGNPHQKNGYASHHNAYNPKLDIRTHGNGKELAKKLESTGYFSRISIESNHLDVQIDITKFKNFEAVA